MDTAQTQWELFAVKECPYCQVAQGVLEALGTPYITHWYTWEELRLGGPFQKALAQGAHVPKKEVPFMVRGTEVLQDSLAIALALAPRSWHQTADFLLWRSADDLARLVYMLYALPEPMKGQLATGDWVRQEMSRIQDVGRALLETAHRAGGAGLGPVAWRVWNRVLDSMVEEVGVDARLRV